MIIVMTRWHEDDLVGRLLGDEYTEKQVVGDHRNLGAGRRYTARSPSCAHEVSLEATGGFEPPNRGFADLRLNHLATSPRPRFPGAEGGI